MDPDPDPRKEIEEDPDQRKEIEADPDLVRGLKWIRSNEKKGGGQDDGRIYTPAIL